MAMTRGREGKKRERELRWNPGSLTPSLGALDTSSYWFAHECPVNGGVSTEAPPMINFMHEEPSSPDPGILFKIGGIHASSLMTFFSVYKTPIVKLRSGLHS